MLLEDELVLSSSPVELELELELEVLSPDPPEVVSSPPGDRQKPSSSQVASESQQLESSAHHSPTVPDATHSVSHVKSSATGVSPNVRRAEQLCASSVHGEHTIASPSASQHGSAG